MIQIKKEKLKAKFWGTCNIDLYTIKNLYVDTMLNRATISTFKSSSPTCISVEMRAHQIYFNFLNTGYALNSFSKTEIHRFLLMRYPLRPPMPPADSITIVPLLQTCCTRNTIQVVVVL